jgi:hypothetical protein
MGSYIPGEVLLLSYTGKPISWIPSTENYSLTSADSMVPIKHLTSASCVESS